MNCFIIEEYKRGMNSHLRSCRSTLNTRGTCVALLFGSDMGVANCEMIHEPMGSQTLANTVPVSNKRSGAFWKVYHFLFSCNLLCWLCHFIALLLFFAGMQSLQGCNEKGSIKIKSNNFILPKLVGNKGQKSQKDRFKRCLKPRSNSM